MNYDLANRFSYHKPNDTTAETHGRVRGEIGSLAEFLDRVLPSGREKSTAITRLEEAMFWANAAIARNTATPVTWIERPAEPAAPAVDN